MWLWANCAKGAPPVWHRRRCCSGQADFIESSIGNVVEALRDGAIMVAIVLFAFLLSAHHGHFLLAIPLSLAVTALVFQALGESINVMTLGGLAIAIGELVDDAVVDVENIVRRLQLNRQAAQPPPAMEVIWRASVEVRSGIVYATVVVVLVFVPLFALPGIEGACLLLWVWPGIVSILASMLVSMTVTPVLSSWLLPRMKRLGHGDSPLVAWLKRQDTRLLNWSFPRMRVLLTTAVLGVLLAAASVPFFPRTFLPAFNEGSMVLSVLFTPGTSLAEANRAWAPWRKADSGCARGGASGPPHGRAEQDEHAEGVHLGDRSGPEAQPAQAQTIIGRFAPTLVGATSSSGCGPAISHRLDHLLSGVRAQIAVQDLRRRCGCAARHG